MKLAPRRRFGTAFYLAVLFVFRLAASWVGTRRRFSSATYLAVVLGTSVVACGQILGLSDFTNECGGPLDATCPDEGQGGSLPHACTPGTFRSCYSGPEGSETKGICHPGKQTCNADGTGYGACENERTPADHEDCSNDLDDDCNGPVNDGCACKHGTETRACYTGPGGTEGKGTCKPGLETCAADGNGFGPCDGEVTPAPADDCATPFDENCDGQVNDACTCDPGSTMACYDGTVDTKDVGNCKAGTLMCKPDGSGYGTCAGEVTPAAQDDYDAVGDENCDGLPTSDTVWAFSYGDTSYQAGDAVAVDSMGNVYFSGAFAGDMQVGTATLHASNASFLVKLDATGAVLYAKHYEFGQGGLGGGPYTALAVDVDDNLVFATSLAQPTDFGLGTAVQPGVAVVGFAPNGTPLWQTGCVGNASPLFNSPGLAVSAAGEVAISMNFNPTIDCGGSALNTVNPDGLDLAVAVWNVSTGTPAHLWSQAFGSASSALQVPPALAFDGLGALWVAGGFAGPGPFSSQITTPANAKRAFIAQFSASSDGPFYGTSVTNQGGSQNFNSIAIDRITKSPVVALAAYGAPSFQLPDGVTRTTPAVVAIDRQSLGVDWVHELPAGVTPTQAILEDKGTCFVTGWFSGQADFGGGMLTVAGFADAFLVHFDPIHPPGFIYQKQYASPYVGASAQLVGLATAPGRDIALGGYFTGEATFGANTATSFDLHSPGATDNTNAIVMSVSR